LLFGLSCAPAVFQRIVERVLQNIPGTANYMDGIIVSSSTEKEHLANLALTLAKLKESGFRLRMDKCKFFQSKIECLNTWVMSLTVRAYIPNQLRLIP